MDIFDLVTINVFAQDDIARQMDLVFNCSVPPPLDAFMKVFKAVMEIYGVDSSGEKNLFPFEVDQIFAYQYWGGRAWEFNEENVSLPDEADDELAYAVELDIRPGVGLSLSIVYYK